MVREKESAGRDCEGDQVSEDLDKIKNLICDICLEAISIDTTYWEADGKIHCANCLPEDLEKVVWQ